MIAKITTTAPTAMPAMAPTPMALLVVVEASALGEELDCRGTLLITVPEADVAAAVREAEDAAAEVRDSELTVTVRGPAVAPRVMPRLE